MNMLTNGCRRQHLWSVFIDIYLRFTYAPSSKKEVIIKSINDQNYHYPMVMRYRVLRQSYDFFTKWIHTRWLGGLQAGLIISSLIYSASMIWLAIISGARHDYVGYLKQWELVLSTSNPWATDNAYGPLHNLLAYATYFDPLFPKLIMVSMLLIANTLLTVEISKTSKEINDYLIYIIAVPLNFLIITMVFMYGLNDSLVATFIILAIISRRRHKMVLAGVFLAGAILIKYYPIFIVPLFALQKRRFNLHLLVSVMATLTAGFLVTVLLWDATFLTAVSFGASRGPKLLSILRALHALSSLVGGHEFVHFLLDINLYCIMAVEIFIIYSSWKLQMNWLESSVLGLLSVLLTYKVGHQQFFIPWLFMVASLPLINTTSARRLARYCLPFVFFLSLFQWGYTFGTDQYTNVLGIVRSCVGFVSFSLGMIILVSYYKWVLLHQRLNNDHHPSNS